MILHLSNLSLLAPHKPLKTYCTCLWELPVAIIPLVYLNIKSLFTCCFACLGSAIKVGSHNFGCLVVLSHLSFSRSRLLPFPCKSFLKHPIMTKLEALIYWSLPFQSYLLMLLTPFLWWVGWDLNSLSLLSIVRIRYL